MEIVEKPEGNVRSAQWGCPGDWLYIKVCGVYEY